MKKKIVIASTLKPVNDVRAYWKISQSIAKTNKYEVNIIGNASKKANDKQNIKSFAHKIFRNQWIKRIYVREHILFKTIKLRPCIFVVTTHELLNAALIVKLFTGCKVVYDVQENYFLNLKVIKPSPMKVIAAQVIRIKEMLSSLFVSEYWLAEKCYQAELPFVKHKFTVLENKAFAHAQPARNYHALNLLFSGTISSYSGIDLAMLVFEQILAERPDTTFHIIGQIHDQKLEESLKSAVGMHPGLSLRISQEPIPYQEILEAISKANLGVIAYQPNQVNRDKLPTKLYEYSRYKLPYLVEKDTRWHEEGSILGGAIGISFTNPNLPEAFSMFENSPLLFADKYPQKGTWEYEEEKLLNSLNRLTHNI